MVQFWNVLYENVLLEYMYVNGLNWAVPRLEVIRDDCRAAASVETVTASAATITAATATISINGSAISSVLVNGMHEKSKDSCSASSSVNISEEFSSASANIEVGVDVEADRKQLIPLGGTYVHNLPMEYYSLFCVWFCSSTHTYTYNFSSIFFCFICLPQIDGEDILETHYDAVFIAYKLCSLRLQSCSYLCLYS
jgi:hypothetical protein